jgi:hypothetical protein
MPDTSESGPVWSVTVAGASNLAGAVVMNAWYRRVSRPIVTSMLGVIVGAYMVLSFPCVE